MLDFFFREIQRGLHQHAQMDQSIAQAMHFLGKSAREGSRRAPRGRFGAGVDQIRHGLGLRQIHLVIQKSPLGELAGLRNAHAFEHLYFFGGLDHPRDQQLQHHRPAMRLQLDHVFAGEGMRCRKVDKQPLVNRLAVCSQEFKVFYLSSPDGFCARRSQKRSKKRLELLPRNTHNAYRPAPWRRGDGNDGVLVFGEHGW